MFKFSPHYKFVTCIRMIAVASNTLIIVFNVGISPIKNQVKKPNIIVPIPNPANLIFQNAPKCSNDHLVEYQYNGAITRLRLIMIAGFLINFTDGQA